MSEIDEEIRGEVLSEVYRQIEELDWDGLSPRERSRCYEQWVNDPLIGDKLARFIPREKVRVWIKDGPVKELPRVRNGIGPNAKYAFRRYPTADQIARQVLGPEWQADLDTLDVKPTRCVVKGSGSERLMMWAPAQNLQDLVWAGINARVDDRPEPLLVIGLPQGQRLGEGEQARHRRVARIAGLELIHTTLRLMRVAPR
ncbi:hypothetical protein [Streptomyces hainanensis]|uniref:Uncharacterized protein n=1 Tax=Streptomyces hainanensis TaxID=402648 RepID=A0A4R4T8N0_9ACTN|nr:hypothetical protein [Streptomyces hainanensis]TDC70689.1 hypothetical protein E1283_24395 [Streptomyces hainanensis]